MVKMVRVVNCSTEDMLKMQAELAKYDIPLATNQCEFSILRLLPETSELLHACRDNDIVFQSYSSFPQGKLAGKHTNKNLSAKEYRFASYPMEELEQTLKAVESIAKAYNMSTSAVALSSNMSEGCLAGVGDSKISAGAWVEVVK
jgi:aryl-alcohol dehydrogenase-like predicted oxidoreductase